MERKIGEIFEFGGEWYQCIIRHCNQCSFDEECSFNEAGTCKFIGNSYCAYRNDKKLACFKKLEKVGETYEKRVSDGTFSTFQRYRVYNSVILPKEPYMYYNFIDGTIEIKIKQNKEDMEMKKVFMNGDDRDYLLDRLEDILHDNHCLEYKDEICNSLCKYITSDNRELKPFNLEAALAGKSVCTRDGRKARIICFDRKFYHDGYNYPIVAMVNDNDNELVHAYTQDGLLVGNMEGELDLMMLPEKKEGWVNIYNRYSAELTSDGYFYFTKEEALSNIENDGTYVKTIKMSWEE